MNTEDWIGGGEAFAGLYLLIGAGLALVRLRSRLMAVDKAARHGSWGFHLAVFPGLMLLWPWFYFVAQPIPEAEAVVSARTQRGVNGRAFQLLAVLIPVLAAIALFWREPAFSSLPVTSWSQANPAPWQNEIPLKQNLIPTLPVSVRLGLGPERQLVFELSIPERLKEKALAVYWSPDDTRKKLPDSEQPSPDTTVFLGMVQGPATIRYEVPHEFQEREPIPGYLYFVNLRGEADVWIRFPLERK